MERGDFIKCGVVSGVISSVGCVGKKTPSKDTLEKLGPVMMDNQPSGHQNIRKKIARDGEEVLYDDNSLSPQSENSSENTVFDWQEDNTAAEWAVSATLNSNDWESERFGVDLPPYCHVVDIRVRERDFDPHLIVVHDCAAITESKV